MMKKNKSSYAQRWIILAAALLTIFISFNVNGQTDIPLGTWRVHLSYNNLLHITDGNEQIFAATESGILAFNKSDGSLVTYNTLNGLSSTGISALSFDKVSNQLWVGYDDGNLDIIKGNEVINFSRLRDLNTIVGSKQINDISFHDHLAYLATDYGVVVFNVQQSEVKETWRDLGPAGAKIKTFQTLFFSDSIIVATEKGLMFGALSDNLLDFKNWKRIDGGDFNTHVEAIAVFNNIFYATIDGSGLYRYSNGTFVKESFLQGIDFNELQASPNNLVISGGGNVWLLNTSNVLIQVADDAIQKPRAAIEDLNGILWIADEKKGLVSNVNGDFVSYLPNGPAQPVTFRLVYADKKMFALAGGFNNAGEPLNNNGTFDYFERGMWSSISTMLTDITDLAFVNTSLHIASFGKGLLQQDASLNQKLYDDTNSPLQNLNPPGKQVNISAVAASDRGLWVMNYGASEPLLLLKNDGTWQSFSLNFPLAKYATDIAIDYSGNVWMVIEPVEGGGLLVLSPNNNTSEYLTIGPGNGGLPHNNVRAITTDREGNIWIGTDEGVAYFFSPEQDAIKPLFENRALLKDEKITAIEIDGGNRKWIGTEHGIWLFNPEGEQLIQNFTVDNSPLLADNIQDIEIQDETGEVFIATEKGIISYRADATTSSDSFQKIKIFPNPVSANFSGMIGISGLATDAYIKITDVSGKLIWETQANGGTATWNVRDYKGRRASTGIYLVFAASQDGSERVVGKIAVVD